MFTVSSYWTEYEPVERVIDKINELVRYSGPRRQKHIRVGEPNEMYMPAYDNQFSFDEYIVILNDHYIHINQFPRIKRHSIVRESVLNCIAQDGKVESDSLSTEIRNIEQAFCRSDWNRYTVISTISLPPSSWGMELVVASDRQSNHGPIKIEIREPEIDDFTTGMAETIVDGHFLPMQNIIPEGYSSLMVELSARSSYEAFEVADDKMNLVRGMWSLMFEDTPSQSIKFPTPLTYFVRGPFTMVPAGYDVLIRDTVSVNPIPANRIYDVEKGALKSSIKGMKQALDSHPYRKELQDIIIMYARALDSTTPEQCLGNLWAMMETLTGVSQTDERVSHEEIVPRAARCYDRHGDHDLMVDLLRGHRNRYVHDNDAIDEVTILAKNAKRYVSNMVHLNILHGYSFRSTKGFAETVLARIDTDELMQKSFRNAVQQVNAIAKARSFLDRLES